MQRVRNLELLPVDPKPERTFHLLRCIQREEREIEIFYNGLNGQTRTIVDAVAGGTLMAKTAEAAYSLLDDIDTNNWSVGYINKVSTARKVSKLYRLRKSKQIEKSMPIEESIHSPENEEDQIVAEQENQAEETPKAYKHHSLSFPDNPPVLKPAFPFPNMSNYAKFMKEVMSRKRKLEEYETMELTEKCSTILRKKLSQKRKDLGSFTILYTIRSSSFDKALCDFGVSINLMPLSVFKKLGLREVKPTTVTLQLADFMVLDMEEDQKIPLIFDFIDSAVKEEKVFVEDPLEHCMMFSATKEDINTSGRKLNKATRKNHFPFPFIDQMLDRLAGDSHYCSLDGYSSYNQITIAPED
ncbi:uncharacterized protein LOC111366699 [Olea europaea var. sylvestris]|uniref:uncharacterized protein LOC111366699 n=1 Tax=Olea europaea var. sylvestris TaxID=158386 RepID=UPI000C1CF0AC|nr:uncharacterized protein LOC111366699 [Olea europaea var. sylvestris]